MTAVAAFPSVCSPSLDFSGCCFPPITSVSCLSAGLPPFDFVFGLPKTPIAVLDLFDFSTFGGVFGYDRWGSNRS